jgi:nitroreductase
VEFAEVVRQRRMVRTFGAERVPDEAVEQMLRHAARAPSAGFSQGQAFLVLDRAEDLARFWRVASGAVVESVRTAPLVIVPMACKRVYLDRYAEPDKGWTDRDEARWPVPFWYIDTAMAAMSMLLTAVDEGLGALFFGILPHEVQPFREQFGVPADHDPIGALAIGYDAEEQKRDLRHRRKPLESLVHRGHW